MASQSTYGACRNRHLPWLTGAIAALVALASMVCTASAGASNSHSGSNNAKFNLSPGLKGSAPASVRIGFRGGYALSELPIYVAWGAGFFNAIDKRFHTSIAFDIYASTNGEPAFLDGTDQFYGDDVEDDMSSNVAQKDQLSIFNEGISLNIPLIASPKSKPSHGTDIKTFNGPTWCEVSGPGGAADTVMKLLAKSNHLDISNFGLVDVGGTAAVLPSVIQGRCSLMAADPASTAVGVVNKQAYVVANTIPSSTTVKLAGAQIGAPLQTSHAFASKYPKLTQAIVDAVVKGLLFIQANVNRPSQIYKVLPPGMKSTLTMAEFDEGVVLSGNAYSSKYNNGTFTAGMIADSETKYAALGVIPSATAVSPRSAFTNEYVIQAYKDLSQTIPKGPQNGPATLPRTVGLPSLEAATAYATLTGKPVPANSGPSPLSN
jgi:ABC-type nitrate/sulfonate/bicarbonate transport system substrate-binding protein